MHRPRSMLALLFTIVGSLLMLLALSGPISAGGVRLSATLTGVAEIPDADPDGSGSFTGWLNPGQGSLCYELSVSNIAPATLSHIHINFSDANGPIVIDLIAPTSGSSSACIDVARHKLMAVLKAPQAFYVNVHNTEFPGGAIRGQLHK